MNFIQTIETMKTVRDYKNKPVPADMLRELIARTQATEGLLSDKTFSIRVIEDGPGFFEMMNGKAGYFGKMIEAPQYVALFDNIRPGAYENSGYLMEFLRLNAWHLELGTCWLSMDAPLDLTAWVSEPVTGTAVALVAIGYTDSGLFRQDILKTSSRMPLSDLVYLEKWNQRCPLEELETRGLSEILFYGKLAPSWGNRQPWRFILHREKVYLTVPLNTDEKRARTDAGIVMLYVQQAAHDRGMPMNWALLEPDESLRQALSLPDSETLIASLS
ncbi:nitroreductase family protein [Anoxynatronum buryatiense]|uniref:TM nitroreductase n=1 Tax=Anoxynatronum buryatiense TaxID=489973 RepID=A0AA45WXM3_9CLOT|nr:nitroreductase family protein [Anoxynatronum buryatiense]SMP64913.1 Putative TM nitroreductase [Anoxynatronum buryatiense]